MQEWEYATLVVDTTIDNNQVTFKPAGDEERTFETEEEALVAIGEEGWENTSTIPVTVYHYYDDEEQLSESTTVAHKMIFKRPVNGGNEPAI